MHFLILAHDRPGMLEQRLAHRPAHLDYWTNLGDALKIAGPLLDGDTSRGSMFLVEAEDEAAARVLLDGDPFMREGVFGDDVRIEATRPTLGVWRPA